MKLYIGYQFQLSAMGMSKKKDSWGWNLNARIYAKANKETTFASLPLY